VIYWGWSSYPLGRENIMAHAVVAYREGKSPLAKFVTLDKDEADAMCENNNEGRGSTYYQVEDYNPDVHTGQPQMTAEAAAEVGPMALAAGQLNRIRNGYHHEGAEKGEEPPKEDRK
jgi:hypothetical protein